jgi:carbamoyl-phosphate synthase large subunit
MKQITLLFSSAGRRVELIQCFREAARHLKLNLVVIAIDMDPSWSPACQIADLCFRVPRCTSDEFPGQIAALCKQHEVDLIIPTIDPELPVYASIRNSLATNGTEVLVSSEAFIRVARDKEATAHILGNHGIPVPRTWSVGDVLEEVVQPSFPLLLKPKAGSCSKGIVTINSRVELEGITLDAALYVLQEICTGEEFTINCFYDRSGACMACVPHFRKFVRDGEVCFAQTERVPAFTEIAHSFSDIFEGLWGSLCFQGYRAQDDRVKVFEINARFGGGYPICDHAGGTFARWILQDLMGQEPDYHDNWRERVRMLRYDAAIFIEV